MLNFKRREFNQKTWPGFPSTNRRHPPVHFQLQSSHPPCCPLSALTGLEIEMRLRTLDNYSIFFQHIIFHDYHNMFFRIKSTTCYFTTWWYFWTEVSRNKQQTKACILGFWFIVADFEGFPKTRRASKKVIDQASCAVAHTPCLIKFINARMRKENSGAIQHEH